MDLIWIVKKANSERVSILYLDQPSKLAVYIGVIARAQDSLAQESMTNDLYFRTRDFSRIFLRIL